MGAAWTLLYGTDERALSAWGISSRAQVTFKSAEADEFVFEIPQSDCLSVPTFPIDATLKLKKDGVFWFVGTVRKITTSGSGQNERHSYVVRNFWDQLERIVYQQTRSIAATDFLSVSQQATSDVVLCQDPNPSTGIVTKTDAGSEIDAIITYARTYSIPFTAVRSYVAPTPPSETARDITCAAALRRMLSWSPDVVTWVDYTSGTAVLKMHNRAGLTAVDVNMATSNPEDFSITPRNDLVPAGVVVNLLYTAINATDGLPYTRLVQQQAGTTVGVGVIVATVDLPSNQDGTFEAVPTGPAGSGTTFAQAYYTALATVFFDGTLRIRAEDCAGTIRPGNKLNFTGTSNAAWTTAAALVQEVTEDLFYGRTEIRVGPPATLSLNDQFRLGAMRFKQLRRDPRTQPPRPPDPNGKDDRPNNNGPCVELDLCSGETVRVPLCSNY